MQARSGPSASEPLADAGTAGRIAGSLRMRLLTALPLLLLAACDQSGGGKPGMSTNIVEEQSSYDVNNRSPVDDESLTPDNMAEPADDEAARQDEPQPSSGRVIPKLLQGRWTGVNDACGDRSADLELTVTPDSLIFHESVGTVKDVETVSAGRFRVTAAFTGEGDSWTRRVELRPSANGRELIMVNDGAAVTRKRC